MERKWMGSFVVSEVKTFGVVIEKNPGHLFWTYL
jgi:hypothetical protein